MIPVLVPVDKILKKIAKIWIFLCRVVSIFVIQQIHLEKYAYSFFFFKQVVRLGTVWVGALLYEMTTCEKKDFKK